MKSKCFLVFALMFGSIVAEETIVQEATAPQDVNQEFGYFSAGLGPFPFPLPVFAGGYRKQLGHHGMDLSLQSSTVVYITQVKTNFLYHYYFKPSLSSQFYVGGGIGPSMLLGRKCKEEVFLSPEFVFGKQYRNETNDLRFFQMQVSFPTFVLGNGNHHNHIFKLPLMVISYGIGF